jgi:hypothetical protein
MLLLMSGNQEVGVYYRNRCDHFKIAVSSGSLCCNDPPLDGRLYWGTRPSLDVNVMLSTQGLERLALMCSVISENDKIMGYVGWIELSDPKDQISAPYSPMWTKKSFISHVARISGVTSSKLYCKQIISKKFSSFLLL